MILGYQFKEERWSSKNVNCPKKLGKNISVWHPEDHWYCQTDKMLKLGHSMVQCGIKKKKLEQLKISHILNAKNQSMPGKWSCWSDKWAKIHLWVIKNWPTTLQHLGLSSHQEPYKRIFMKLILIYVHQLQEESDISVKPKEKKVEDCHWIHYQTTGMFEYNII